MIISSVHFSGLSLTMASKELIEQSIKETFQEIKNRAPDDYAKIESDPHLKEATTEVARSAVAEEVDFDREFLQNPGEEVVGLLSDNLSEERIQIIKEAFSIPTFDMEVIHAITRGREEFIPWVEWSL